MSTPTILDRLSEVIRAAVEQAYEDGLATRGCPRPNAAQRSCATGVRVRVATERAAAILDEAGSCGCDDCEAGRRDPAHDVESGSMTTTHYPALVAREPAEGRGWLIEADTPEGEAQLAYDGDMRHALAHLLCAAPDLLAACEEALEARVDTIRTAYGVRNARNDSPAVVEAVGADYLCVALRSAIARATGGAS